MTWPPSVLIFFFWSPFPESPTKRFLLRSLRDHSSAQVAAKMSDWYEEMCDCFLPSHQGFVLAQSVPFVPHQVQDGRGGLLLKGSGLATEAQPETKSRAGGWNLFGLFRLFWDVFGWMNASPSLWLKVFGLVGDVVFLVFASLPAPLVSGPFIAICLLPSFPANHGREHPLVEEWIITFYET